MEEQILKALTAIKDQNFWNFVSIWVINILLYIGLLSRMNTIIKEIRATKK